MAEVLKSVLARLSRRYGAPAIPPAHGPFELVLWENACYLLPDDRRLLVFEGLRHLVGLDAHRLLGADPAVLLPLAKLGGMRPETRVFRWLEIARITVEQFGGDLDRVLGLPYSQAKKALKQFPTIGDPGAEKILLLCGVGGGLPLESNGLRVLLRLGYGRTSTGNYGREYSSVQEAIAKQLPPSVLARARAHLLLREHGKTLCHRNAPECDACPLATCCPSRQKTRQSG